MHSLRRQILRVKCDPDDVRLGGGYCSDAVSLACTVLMICAWGCRVLSVRSYSDDVRLGWGYCSHVLSLTCTV